MLRMRKEPARKSFALSMMRDLQGSAAEKLRMFEKVRAAGCFANEHPADLAKAEKMLREFAGMKKGRWLTRLHREKWLHWQSRRSRRR